MNNTTCFSLPPSSSINDSTSMNDTKCSIFSYSVLVIAIGSLVLHSLLAGVWIVCVRGRRRYRQQQLLSKYGNHKLGDPVPNLDVDGYEAAMALPHAESASRAYQHRRTRAQVHQSSRTRTSPEFSPTPAAADNGRLELALSPDFNASTSFMSRIPPNATTTSCSGLAESSFTQSYGNEAENKLMYGSKPMIPQSRTNFMHLETESNSCAPENSGECEPQFVQQRLTAARSTASRFPGNDVEIELAEFEVDNVARNTEGSRLEASTPLQRGLLTPASVWTSSMHRQAGSGTREPTTKNGRAFTNSPDVKDKSSRVNGLQTKGRVEDGRLQQRERLEPTGSAVLSGFAKGTH